MLNPYLPQSVKVKKIESLTPNIVQLTYRVSPKRISLRKSLMFTPGQFVLAGIWGVGEAPFELANNPFETQQQAIVVRNTGGQVTSALHRIKIGDTITIRGPYGNGFPLKKMKGADIVAIAGGCGIPPIASLMEYIVQRRREFGKVFLVYGASDPKQFALREKFTYWRKHKIDVVLTIDKKHPGWRGRIGYVSDHLKNLSFDPEITYGAMCGPGPMSRASAKILCELGVTEQRIMVSEERKMSCGIGKCQHCTCGKFYVCTNGPVFSYNQIKDSHD